MNFNTFYLRPGLQSGLFPSGSTNKILQFSSLSHAIRTTQLSLLQLMILIMSGKELGHYLDKQ